MNDALSSKGLHSTTEGEDFLRIGTINYDSCSSAIQRSLLSLRTMVRRPY